MDISNNKWLKRIFSIEFAALVVAIIAAYFAYLPIKNYIVDESKIVLAFNNQQIKLSHINEKCDTIKIIAYTFNYKSIPTSNIITLKNISNRIIKGLNVKSEYFIENAIGMISWDWKYDQRGESGSCSYLITELPPFGEIPCPLTDISITNFDEPLHSLSITTTVAYEGCKKQKYISLIIYLNNIDVSDIFNNRYGNGTVDENRLGFNEDFIKKCVEHTYNNYYLNNPNALSYSYVLMNTYNSPEILSMNEAIELHKRHL